MKKQRIFYIVMIALILVINVIYFVFNDFSLFEKKVSSKRGNMSSVYDEKRVFDNGDVLTDDEEEKLSKLINEKQKKSKIDIVIVTENSYDIFNLEAYADDFYDNGKFGYDKDCGDGILIADNWAGGDAWVSTCGRMIDAYNDEQLQDLFKEVSSDLKKSPYEGYETFIEEVSSRAKSYDFFNSYGGSLISLGVALIVTIIYLIFNLRNRGDEVKANKNTYVKDGNTKVLNREDFFIGKSVTSRTIKSNSSGGGSHKSGGGVSHGGGGFKH